MYYYISPSCNDLIHHGVLGMKWGVRRYQNKDGSLTAAGKRHYGKMTGDQVHEELSKKIQKQRSRVHGSAKAWIRQTDIGENSKKLIDERKKQMQKYYDSKEFQQWNKKRLAVDEEYGELEDPGDDRWYDILKDYEKKRDKVYSERPVQDFNTLDYGMVGKEYTDDFINKGGRDLSMAYLKDLGYSEQIADELIKKMAKANKTLGDL